MLDELLKKERQPEFTFSYLIPKKEMGWGITENPPYIFLFDNFIRKYLRTSMFDVKVMPNKKTNVVCPFCEKGFLELVSVEPEYSGGPGRAPHVLYHVGNSYSYKCTICPARFHGQDTWMYID